MFPHSSSRFGLQPSPRPGLSWVPSGVLSRDPSSDSWVREFPGWDRSLLAPDFSWNFPFPGRRVRSRSFLLELGITGPSLGTCLDFWVFRVLVTRRVGHPLYRCPRTPQPWPVTLIPRCTASETLALLQGSVLSPQPGEIALCEAPVHSSECSLKPLVSPLHPDAVVVSCRIWESPPAICRRLPHTLRGWVQLVGLGPLAC